MLELGAAPDWLTSAAGGATAFEGHFAALAPFTRILIRYNPFDAVMKSVRLS